MNMWTWCAAFHEAQEATSERPDFYLGLASQARSCVFQLMQTVYGLDCETASAVADGGAVGPEANR